MGPVYQLAWSCDSRLLASASKDSTLKVRADLAAHCTCHGVVSLVVLLLPARLLMHEAADGPGGAAAMYPQNECAQVWDVSTRKLVEDLPGHADEVFCVDWSPSGGVVASGAKDALVRLWKR